MGRDRFILTDAEEIPGDVCLADIRIRRCRGCVKCLTETAGKCVIEDDFSPLLDVILGTTQLVIRMGPEHGMMPDRVRKAVERLSNVLDAYTDVGGNIPLENDETRLHSVVFECRSGFADRMEPETVGALRKGPVSEVLFIDSPGPGSRCRPRWDRPRILRRGPSRCPRRGRRTRTGYPLRSAPAPVAERTRTCGPRL